jgi:hypothetical protein
MIQFSPDRKNIALAMGTPYFLSSVICQGVGVAFELTSDN